MSVEAGIRRVGVGKAWNNRVESGRSGERRWDGHNRAPCGEMFPSQSERQAGPAPCWPGQSERVKASNGMDASRRRCAPFPPPLAPCPHPPSGSKPPVAKMCGRVGSTASELMPTRAPPRPARSLFCSTEDMVWGKKGREEGESHLPAILLN